MRQRGWLAGELSSEMAEWLGEASNLLGPQATMRSGGGGNSVLFVESLLALVFVYDAAALLEGREAQVALAREGAREVIRELAHRILSGPDVDSNRFREIADEMKASLGFHGRKLFGPIRLALAGRVGEGELDRVILLLDPASKLNFRTPVKGTRQRLLEFCAALD